MRAWRRVLVVFAFPFLLLFAVVGIFLMIVGDRSPAVKKMKEPKK